MPKDPYLFLGVRVSPEMLERLNTYARQKKGEDRSDIVRRFIQEGLDREAPAARATR